MKRKYDLIFGVGMVCSCSESLRAARLQLLSFPGDWTAPLDGNPAHNLCIVADEMCNELVDAFHLEDFFFREKIEENGKDAYVNRRTRYLYNHDFPSGVPIAESFTEVEAKYRRRLARLFSIIRSSKRVLMVRIDQPDYLHPTTREDCDYALDRFSKKFPGVTFEMILVQPDEKFDFENPKVEKLGDRITRFALDYRDKTPGRPKRMLNVYGLGEMLARHVSVRDYRTSEERRRHREKARRRHWAKYGATTFVGYVLAKIKRMVGVRP